MSKNAATFDDLQRSVGAALRKTFRTPQEAIRALGLDAKLLKPARGMAFDEVDDPDLADILAALQNKLDPETFEKVCALLQPQGQDQEPDSGEVGLSGGLSRAERQRAPAGGFGLDRVYPAAKNLDLTAADAELDRIVNGEKRAAAMDELTKIIAG